ncbi:MAG: polyphosphate:AMP phosphotransferase [Rhodocyclaceae bacterium]|nr:polyphosphate:AMP phosphotransferase [Rhodocyclaceae bacterium]MCA3026947.1 polyphosphate:AMP phosphotransferase [Rhodocyclaceae bacterium]MCA3033554.1 polyphosphate:AMP phosphotransferase [Rhodocyclaceae bacterium]MCA3045411.1 polyphosphate:AMP phosphotransferase [Rhodocyclaceae bacterium]MCA3050710.1 polyphosphate:AMP phosphotransferase [Rhodocyclaceae bacterium]
MFETAEIGHKLKKSEFVREEPKLRAALLDAQYQLLADRKFPVIILVNGVDGAGKGETVNLLNEWMDPRHIHTHAFGASTDAERARPEMWRFWQALPPKGKIGILFGSWYTDPILQRVMESEDAAEFDRRLARIRDHERMLVAEGALIIKLWFHLSKDAQTKRLKALSAKRKTAWRVTKEDWKRFKHYDEFVGVCELALRETSTGEAPWNIIEGSDHAYRSLTAGRLLLDSLTRRLKGSTQKISPVEPLPQRSLDKRDILNTVDYTHKLGHADYDNKLSKLQGKLSLLTRHKKMRDRSIVMLFEGMDAAGKGSTIRRITRAMDARFYHIVPVAAPTDEERAQPYLWRFWRHIPPHGHAVIFDRSWYGRVLVERVEKFCGENDWMRAYHEINEFEEQLVVGGAIVVKFWMAISQAEQLKRFRERAKTPHKQFKITDEDWRNRKRWPDYERAVADMIERTSSVLAPWHVIASNDKPWSRVETLKRLCETIEGAL